MNASVYCLNCLRDIRKSNLYSFMIVDDLLCDNCRKQIKYQPVNINIDGIKVRSLFCYRGLIRDLLIQYKEKKDEALAYCFLYPYIKKLSKKYKDYYLIAVPSSEKAVKERGFYHVEKIFSILNLKQIHLIKKKSNFQQKKSHSLNIEDEFYIDGDISVIKDKKVLLVDDIITTGSSLKACYKLLKGNCREIKVLTLTYNAKYKKCTFCEKCR